VCGYTGTLQANSQVGMKKERTHGLGGNFRFHSFACSPTLMYASARLLYTACSSPCPAGITLTHSVYL